MCYPASFVLTRDRVYWSMRTDSHTQIIAEHGLTEDGVRGPNVVKIEITPPCGRLSADPADWTYRLDQDLTPDWYDAEACERRGRHALTDWLAARVFTEGEHEVADGAVVWSYGNSTVTARGNSTVTARDSSTVTARDSSTVTVWGNSTVTAWDSSTVTAWDSSTVTTLDSSTATTLDNSTVTAWDNSTVTAQSSSTVTAQNSSTVTALDSSTVRARDNSTVRAQGASTVRAWDRSTVRARDNSTVNHYALTKPAAPEDNAVVIDRRGARPVCLTAQQPVAV